MKKRFKQVYQFRIELREVKPPVWRRIQVPEMYTFWDLHVAVQGAMGWLDYHLHEFTIIDPSSGTEVQMGIPCDEFEDDIEILPGWDYRIADYFSPKNKVAVYTYDFGDNWQHTIRLEEILPREKNARYPRCLDGSRACPREDCGGPWGYKELLQILKDPEHEEYEEMRDWAGHDFAPEAFSAARVKFDDPDVRWRIAFDDAEDDSVD